MLTTIALLLQLTTPTLTPPAWIPPVGLPVPPAGIIEVAPAPTLIVDYANGPIRSFPSDLPAGTHVRIRGRYPVDYSSPRTIVAHGTASQPVWITGEQGADFTATIELAGTYLYVEHVRFSGFMVVTTPASGGSTGPVVLRDSEITKAGAGIQASYTGSAAGAVHDVVWLRVTCHDIGDMNTTTDADALCLGIYKGRNHHIWFLDSTCTRVSSDCSQANGHTDGAASVHHIYYGRVVCDTNRQGCLWAKQSTDVVISESTCRNMRPDQSGTNPGHCYGGQYGPQRLIIVRNRCEDSENCIRLTSGEGATGLIMGNLARRIHATSTKTGTAWSGGAFLFTGQDPGNFLVTNNTVDDADSVVNQVSGGPTLTLQNQAITRVTQAYKLEDPGRVTIQTSDFPVVYRDVLAGDYRLAEGSPGSGQGLSLPPQIPAAYRELHGVSLNLQTVNVGAELTATGASTPPPEPPPPPPPLPACTWLQRLLRLAGFRVNCQ